MEEIGLLCGLAGERAPPSPAAGIAAAVTAGRWRFPGPESSRRKKIEKVQNRC